jgi:hypothetical protein
MQCIRFPERSAGRWWQTGQSHQGEADFLSLHGNTGHAGIVQRGISDEFCGTEGADAIPNMSTLTKQSLHPWRRFTAHFSEVNERAAGMSTTRNISTISVRGGGFSKGWIKSGGQPPMLDIRIPIGRIRDQDL